MSRFKQKGLAQPAIAALLVGALLGAGCYWSRYPEVMATHLQLLEQYAAKLATLAEDHRPVAVQDWGEFLYPLDRARDFARIAAKRYPDRVSLARFDEALERYAELVVSPELLARPDALEIVEERRRKLSRAILATREALAAEA